MNAVLRYLHWAEAAVARSSNAAMRRFLGDSFMSGVFFLWLFPEFAASVTGLAGPPMPLCRGRREGLRLLYIFYSQLSGAFDVALRDASLLVGFLLGYGFGLLPVERA